jgi:hypothetical protein
MTFETETPAVGTYGATQLSWEHNSARNLLLRIREEHPKVDERTLAKHLRDRAAEEDCELAIFLYFVRNALGALTRRSKRRNPATSKRAAKTKLRLRLLDLVLSNGKLLRDCTGRECERLGKQDQKRGLFLQRVAAEVGPTKHVGDVLGETRLKALMRCSIPAGAKP